MTNQPRDRKDLPLEIFPASDPVSPFVPARTLPVEEGSVEGTGQSMHTGSASIEQASGDSGDVEGLGGDSATQASFLDAGSGGDQAASPD